MDESVRRKILVVDDDELTLEVLGLVLKHLGFDVAKAGSGRAAAAVVKKEGATLALVMLDMKMPGMDGEQTFELLHKLQPDLPFLIYSGWGTGDAVARLLRSGYCAFLPKTFEVEELRKNIAELLAKHSRQATP